MSQAVKVGVFAFIALAVLGYFVLKIEDVDLFGDEGTELAAVFDSVAGLDDKATIRIAGVRVGQVDGVTLEGRRARVGLSIDPEIVLTEGTRARIASLGLLGENYVEIEPGPPGAPPLPPGSVIPGESPLTIDDALGQLASVGESVQQITGAVAGELGSSGGLTSLIDDMAATAQGIRRLVDSNAAQVNATVGHFEDASAALAVELPKLANQLQLVLGEMRAVVAENRPQVGGAVDNVERLTRELQASVDNLNTVTGRLARGEGTVGKLLTSNEAHDSLVSTLNEIESGVESLSGTLGLVNRIELGLDASSFYLQDAGEARSSFTLRLDPKDGKRLYKVGLVDSPRGSEETTTERITVTNPDGTTETTVIETLRRDDDPTLTAMFGFRSDRGPVLWGGLIEDSFGVQVDYPVWSRELWVTLEAFDFDRENDLDPHMRLTGEWRFHPNFYLLGGYDDFLESSTDSLFLGGGLRWTDDNLKALIGSLPSF